MNKENQKEYIEYLEQRLARLTENSSIGDRDLNNLIDAQNQVIVSSALNFKKILVNGNNLGDQFATLQNRLIASDQFINYLTNSYWWKLTSPFRSITRIFRNRKKFSPFDFSNPTKIQEKINVIIYANSFDNSLKKQLANLKNQNYFNSLDITIIDYSNSAKLANYSKDNDISYLNIKSINNDLDLALHLSSKKAEYVIYLDQGIFLSNNEWLYKLIYPVIENYTNLSILYKNTKQIEQIKKNTFFKELKSRIISLDQYEYLFLPTSRDNIQYIPYSIINDASAVAKRQNYKG